MFLSFTPFVFIWNPQWRVSIHSTLCLQFNSSHVSLPTCQVNLHIIHMSYSLYVISMWIETRFHVEMCCDDICERWEKHGFERQRLTSCALSHAICIRIWWVYIPNLNQKKMKHYIWNCYSWIYQLFCWFGIKLLIWSHMVKSVLHICVQQIVFVSRTNHSSCSSTVSGLQRRWGRYLNA